MHNGKEFLVFSFNWLKKKLVEYKWFIIFFIPFLFFQLYQISLMRWDTIPYIFQGKWFCGQQVYLELIRPPVAGFFSCLFGAQDFSFLLSTALACFLYLFALILFYSKNKENLDQLILALFALLFPFILFSSNFGSDLFALAFLLLALVVEKPWKKGFFLALASLSRYNFILFGLIILWSLRKKIKSIPVFVLAFIIPWIPWMVFNYIYSGNPLFSLSETIYLNVVAKPSFEQFSFEQILLILIFSMSLILVKSKKILSDLKNQSSILLIGQLFFSAIKEMRFFVLLVPSIAFNLSFVSAKNRVLKIIFLSFFGLICLIVFSPFINNPAGYLNVAFGKDSVANDDFLHQCRVASDKWVLFYPNGIVAQYLPIEKIPEYLNKGIIIVWYSYAGNDLNKYSADVIYRKDYVILKPTKCLPPAKSYISGSWSYTVFRWLKDTNSSILDWNEWYE